MATKNAAPGASSEPTAGFANAETYRAYKLAHGDYSTEPEPQWQEMVQEAATAGPDPLKLLYMEAIYYAFCELEAADVPDALMAYMREMIGSSLGSVDWQELARRHAA